MINDEYLELTDAEVIAAIKAVPPHFTGYATGLVDRLEIHEPIVQTAAGNVTMKNSGVAICKKTVGAATTVTLPARARRGVFAFVKDGNGDAATNNITVQPDGTANNTTIDGQATHVINVNYGGAIYVHNGSEWSLLTYLTEATTGNTTLNALTLTGALSVSSASAVSAAGTNQGTATALTVDDNNVSTVASGTGVLLPAATAGRCVTVVNSGANTLAVYPKGASDVIGALAATIPLQLPVGQTSVFLCASAGTWVPLNIIGQQSTRTTTSPTNATATMSSGVLSDLTMTVSAGQKISGQLRIFANNSTGAEGLQFDLNGGSATFTSIEFGFAATPAGATVGTATSTAIGTAVTCSAVATSDACYTINFTGVVNAGGTIIPRFGEVSHTSGTATVKLNSSAVLHATSN